MLKKIIYIIILLLLTGFIYNFSKQIVNSLQAGKRLDQASGELAEVQKKNMELKKKLEEVSSPQFIEAQARDKLNLARSNETVFLIAQTEIEKVLGAKKEEIIQKIPNWQGWLRLFIK